MAHITYTSAAATAVDGITVTVIAVAVCALCVSKLKGEW